MVKRAQQNSGKLCLGEAMKTKLSRKGQEKSFPSDITQIYFVYSQGKGYLKVTGKVTQSCPTLRTHGLYSSWNSPGQNT